MKKITRNIIPILILITLFGMSKDQIVQAQVNDPGISGPLGFVQQEYDFGDEFFAPDNLKDHKVELRASVHYPADMSGGPFPLIIFMHGRHVNCFEPDTGGISIKVWPCPGNMQAIPSYRGYDYIGEFLASHGYIVVSVSANGIHAYDSSYSGYEGPSDAGAEARASLIQRHLKEWEEFITTDTGPFGDLFVGKVDLQNVGTMGHSRGGEGVARHYLLNQEQGTPYGIKAVLPLAPINVTRRVVDNVPLGIMLPYCDGDLYNLQGMHYFDDARHTGHDNAPMHSFLIMGANHNFFNTYWSPEGGETYLTPTGESADFTAGTDDDWGRYNQNDDHCDQFGLGLRLTETRQRAMAIAYFSAFFRTYLGNEQEFLPILVGDEAPPSSSTLSDNEIHISYHPPETPEDFLLINPVLEQDDRDANELGGSNSINSDNLVYEYCGTNIGECGLPIEDDKLPHFRMSKLKIAWDNTTGYYENDFGSLQNVSNYQVLQFRAGIYYLESPGNITQQDFTITFTDDNNNVSPAVNVGSASNALYYPPGEEISSISGRFYPLPKLVLNTVRIPLSSFDGVDLTQIQSIRFNFDQTNAGTLFMTDVMFVGEAEIPASDTDLDGIPEYLLKNSG